jgi:hypothetical protein
MKLPTIEEQVCSYSQAVKLFMLGLKGGGSVFCWLGNDPYSKQRKIKLAAYVDHKLWYPAYTVAELGVLLPANLHADDHTYHLFSGRSVDGEYFLGYETEPLKDDFMQFSNTNEAQARAAALIWLLDNNYIKAEDLNG